MKQIELIERNRKLVADLDTMSRKQVAQKYGVDVFPTTLVIRDGQTLFGDHVKASLARAHEPLGKFVAELQPIVHRRSIRHVLASADLSEGYPL